MAYKAALSCVCMAQKFLDLSEVIKAFESFFIPGTRCTNFTGYDKYHTYTGTLKVVLHLMIYKTAGYLYQIRLLSRYTITSTNKLLYYSSVDPFFNTQSLYNSGIFTKCIKTLKSRLCNYYPVYTYINTADASVL